MDNLVYYNKVKEVPETAKKVIGGGRLKGFTDINPMWRIKALTELFGPAGLGWYYKITDKRIETIGNESAAFVDIELYIFANDKWSMPICGTGGSSFVTIEKSGKAYMSDECFKMALTDAISIACKALGFGAAVYYAKDRTKYDGKAESEQATDTTNVTVKMLEQAILGSGKTVEDVLDAYNDKANAKAKTINFIPQIKKKELYAFFMKHQKK